MAVTLGKRTRKSARNNTTDRISSENDDDQTAKALFQRAFEAKFKPLKTVKKTEVAEQIQDVDDESESDEGDWFGFDQEGADNVEIVQVEDVNATASEARSRELKAFMTSSLPKETKVVTTETKKKKSDEDDDPTETANLKNDLALQRLLKESHLLRPSSDKSSGPEMLGKDRLKALDLRMQSLGGKVSHLEQKSMPLSHRRGIQAKSTEREQKRRKDAADNGIVLERAKSAAKTAGPREKGIGGPNIGQFRGGMLKLSSKDVRSIEHSRTNGQKRKRGR